MKKLSLYLVLGLFSLSFMVGCGKKFDENLHKDMLASNEAMKAAEKTIEEVLSKASNDYKAATTGLTLDPAVAQKHTGMFATFTSLVSGHKALMSTHEATIEKYKKGEIKTEDAMTAFTTMKNEQDKMAGDMKQINEGIKTMMADVEAAKKPTPTKGGTTKPAAPKKK
jgi:hypothetical protein